MNRHFGNRARSLWIPVVCLAAGAIDAGAAAWTDVGGTMTNTGIVKMSGRVGISGNVAGQEALTITQFGSTGSIVDFRFGVGTTETSVGSITRDGRLVLQPPLLAAAPDPASYQNFLYFKTPGSTVEAFMNRYFAGYKYQDIANDNNVFPRFAFGVDNEHLFLGTRKAFSVNLSTSDKVRLTVAAGGNVGIANPNPEATLHVGANSGSWSFKIGGLHPGGGGISMANGVPTSTSTVSNSAVGGFLIYTDQDGVNLSNVRSFDIGAREYADQWNGGSQLRFLTSDLAASGTSGTQSAQLRMVIDRKGNVGIGNSAPGVKLDVHGSHVDGQGIIRANSSNHAMVVANAFSNSFQSGFRLSNAGAVMWDIAQNESTNGNNLSFSSAAKPQCMVISQTTGNVGIGAAPSSFKLEVNGTANISGALTVASVKTKVWSIAPDYVFEKGYKLAPLANVERYVNENGHLPEIPSAKEIGLDGIDLAEMNMKLLKKVEEMTLHMIRQEKELKIQAEKIGRLETKLR